MNNLTEISKMAFLFCFGFFFFFACNFCDGMNASVYESKCFELVVAERKNDGILSDSVQKKIPPPPPKIECLSPFYMSDHVYLCFI